MRAKPEMKPWVHTDKSIMSSVGAALTARAFVLCRCGSWLCVLVVVFVWKVPLLRSSRNVWKQLTQGLRPGLCRSIALKGSFTTTPKAMSVRRTYFDTSVVISIKYSVLDNIILSIIFRIYEFVTIHRCRNFS